MNGFWQPLPSLIRQYLLTQKLFYSRAGTLHKSSGLRILIREFVHDEEPLLPESSQLWRFLSAKYSNSYISILKSLGVEVLSFSEALELISYNTSSTSSII